MSTSSISLSEIAKAFNHDNEIKTPSKPPKTFIYDNGTVIRGKCKVKEKQEFSTKNTMGCIQPFAI